MKNNSFTVFRGELSIAGIAKPVKLWWTKEQIMDWVKNKSKYLDQDFLRIKTTPYSMIEVNSRDFEKIDLIDERCNADSFIVRESTLWFQFYKANRIPVPLGTMNDEYDYPCVLLGFNQTFTGDINYFDYTGYFNFKFLEEDKMDILEFLSHPEEFRYSGFNLEDLTVAEYSVPPKL
ncbi:hypothetical protein [Algoriphagus formosus]|uniref:hypothetical protein n=1 Tax=Algoriphagus formosus TaxID=2007308 RepID=UPI000C284716|nr:hypothetical protein [Algoriphagus formosus]